MLKHLEIAPDALEVGYILDEDVYENHVLLIRKGQVVTDHIKELLQTRKTVKIVRHVPEESVYLEEDLSDDRIVRLNEQVKTRITEDVTKLFDDIESDSNASLAQNISDTIVNDVLKKDGVGLNLDELKVSDEYTFKHSVDVAAGSIILAKYLGLGADNIRDIGTAGVLHDIGKIMIPNEILNKNGKLTDKEFAVIKNHPVYGYQMLSKNQSIAEPIRRAVLFHHEKFCGGGYPSGLKGNEIPLYARVLSVIDVFDALVTERPYHKAYSVADTLEVMYTMYAQFDAEVFQAFLKSLIVYPIGSVITLSNGVQAQVIKTNKGYPLRPVVKDIKTGEELDLSRDYLSLLIV